MRWPTQCPHPNHLKLAPGAAQEFLVWCRDKHPGLLTGSDALGYSEVETDRIESGMLAGKLVLSVVIFLPRDVPNLRDLWADFQRTQKPRSPEPTITKD